MDETLDQVMRLVDEGQLPYEKSVELLNALTAERRSAAALKEADAGLKVRATSALIRARHETPLLEEASRPASGRLGMVGVLLDPPTVSFYEASIEGETTPTVTIRGTRYEQGTGPYLQHLLDHDDRFAPALVDLIGRSGPAGEALRAAVADGAVTIQYDHVLVSTDGRIQLSRFHLDSPPRLPALPSTEEAR
ncbi:hypothetical protein EII34_06605 [Arachnia propionica]|uniref:Uncharacterized protein n=1 Tax=Arachnia propionica TaxID=1750 RepID=A0A3P1T7M6_9ACTN|nr:hypothetical protein [Arachnia propionica]MDO5083766.1 hypothetical protein [Arachnia propionica]RRD05399.1 hypothetical protein EII34_06605 [Arachnia propionica]